MDTSIPGLDLGVLEKKDKDELLAIATAMGKKVSARNKKADIVNAIVGAGDAPASAPSSREDATPSSSRRATAKGAGPGSSETNGHASNDVREANKTHTSNGGGASAAGPSADGPDAFSLDDGAMAPARRARPPKPLGEDLGSVATADPVASAAAAAEEPPSWTPRPSAQGTDADAGGPRSAGSRVVRSTRSAPVAAEPDASRGSSGATNPDASRGSTNPDASRGSTNPTPDQQGDESPAASDGAAGSRGERASESSGRNDAHDADQPGQGAARQGQGGQGSGGQGSGGQGPGGQGQAQRRAQGAQAPAAQRQQGGQGQGGQWRDNDSRTNPNNKKRRRGRDRDRQREWEDRAEQPFDGEPVPVAGLVELRDDGFGFLRTKGYLGSGSDCYIPTALARRVGLRKGDHITGGSRPQTNNEKFPGLLKIDTINGLDPEVARLRPKFEDLTPLFPDSKLRMETIGEPGNMTARIVDLISPIGKGQRGLIVSPPKAGKTTVMKQIAKSIERNNPEVHLMVLLVDERPEEVTDMRRTVKGEVIASTFDRPADEHTSVAELCIERAKRLVEMGRDVVIILDGITRLARAYNLAAPATGRIMSGGVDSGALYPPKKFFGAARNVEEGGSLTILASALVETGSKMDEVIFEEFKGTGNMELKLDRRLAERRLFPAIDVNASSTRHEELLFDKRQLDMVWRLRRVLNGLSEGGSPTAGLDLLMERLKQTKSNDEFLAEMAKAQLSGGS